MRRFWRLLLAAIVMLEAAADGSEQNFGQIKLSNSDIRYNDSTRVVDLYKLLLNTDAANSLVVETSAGTDVLVVDTTVPQVTIGGVLITSANIGSSGSRVPVVYATDVNATTATIPTISGVTTLTATTANITTLAGVTTLAAHVHQAAGSGGTLDHGAALTGLTDDDHSQYAKASAINVTRAPYSAVGNGIADDTAAALAALNAAITAHVPLYFPAGTYKITSDGLFSAFTGTYQEGLVVFGDGMESSILYLASPGAGERWFYNNNTASKLAYATFRDLKFEGESSTYCSGFSQWSNGHEKDFEFQRCEFKTLSTAFKTSGSGNADHNTFYDCRFNEISSKVLHLYDNTQSMLHQFHDCIFYTSGDLIYAQRVELLK